MNRELLDRWCERGLLVVVLAMLVFGPLATGAVRTLEFLVLQGLTCVAITLWLARLWLGAKNSWFWPPIGWAVLGFVVYAVVRYQQADIEYVARLELIRILVYAFLFVIILNNLYRQETTQILIFALLTLGMLISLYAVYQFATNSPYVWHFTKPKVYLNRASGTYICPNHLAGFLEMLLPLGWSFLFLSRFGPVAKILLGYMSLVIMVGIGLTISRGGWIATALSAAVFFIILIRNRRYRLPAIVLLVVLVGVGVMLFRQGELDRKRADQMIPEKIALDSRYAVWHSALRIWQDHPWWGAGPAHYNYRFPKYRYQGLQQRPEYAHNDYLNTLADWGLVGALLVTGAWVALYWGAFKTWKHLRHTKNDQAPKRSNKAALVLGTSVGLLAILIHSWVDFNFQIPANAILAVALMALLASQFRYGTDRYRIAPGWVLRCALSLVGVLGLVFLVGQGWKRYQEHGWLMRAQKATSYDQAKAFRKKAFVVEPMNARTAYDIGEVYRAESLAGRDDYQQKGQEAISWYKRALQLNPYDALGYLRVGMCLDWIGKTDQSHSYFQRASELDPNFYYIIVHLGWHWMNVAFAAERNGELDKARQYFNDAKAMFERSFRYRIDRVALVYLPIVNNKIAELSKTK